MVTENGELCCSEKKIKKKNLNNYPKLLVGDKVEVRSVEKEYEGSWHTGTVIACEDESRKVQYDHRVCTDGSNKLIRTIKLPHYIRPLPPPLTIDESSLRSGQCVDAYRDEAWWECVILDKNYGSEKRLVFFPDTGHEVYYTRNNLRITQDWDGFSGHWKPRKNWFFLDLIEEFKQEWPLQVSVKQIWSEVKEEEGFRQDLKRWTSMRYGLWKNLVWKVYSDNLKLFLKHFFMEWGDAAYKSPLSFSEASFDILKPKSHSSSSKTLDEKPASVYENQKYLWLPASSDIVPEPEFCPDSITEFIRMYSSKERPSLVLRQNLRKHLLFLGWKIEFMRLKEKLVYMYTSPEGKSYGTLLNVCESLNGENSDPNPEPKIEEFSCNGSTISPKKVYKKRKNMWEWGPADRLFVPEPKFCPDAIRKFNLLMETKRRGPKSLILNVRKHLSFLGWKIEFLRFKGDPKLRYTSPDGTSFVSLSKAVLNLSEATYTFSVPNQNKEKIVCGNLKGENSDLNSEPKIEEFSCYGSKISPRKVYKKRSHICGPADHHCVPKAEFLPDAIKEYNIHMKTRKGVSKSNILNVRKHLLFLGWKIEFRRLKSAPRLRYTSPDGTSFLSLSKALQNLSETNDTFSVPYQNKAKLVPVLSGQPQPCPEAIERYYLLSDVKRPDYSKTFQDPKNLEVKMKAKKHLVALGWSISSYRRANGKREPLYISKSGKKYGSLRAACKECIAQKCVYESNTFIPMVEESENADEDGDGQTLTQLMLKRNSIEVEVKDIAKVRKGGMKKKNRVTALDSHLLHKKDKKVEAKHLKKRKKRTSSIQSDLTKRPRVIKDRWDPEKSDDICSICHNGGDLMLCDQCPSAFHTMCLGLQCVPDGEWFCPACCCEICGRSRFSSDTKEFGDESVLSCDQCEHKYHVGCLRLRGVLKLKESHNENWFCNERCEQIFLSLRDLLGKPVPVGEENITWTLLKYTKSSDYDQNVPNKEALEENYNKFNVALSVMHECFEPSRERTTRRDVLEDVIFSRWSELNRLNFQGFYTVLLEKNGEVITVATVRVHGEKVAEVPFIGTQVKYRRLGMCRMLMNELEKKLMELGVERLVLPAVPSALNTWIESFRFSKMTELERLNFLDYMFLDFEGTTMCQKFLGEIPSPCLDHLEPEQTIMTLSENKYLDENTVVSKVFQSDPVFPADEAEIADQGAS